MNNSRQRTSMLESKMEDGENLLNQETEKVVNSTSSTRNIHKFSSWKEDRSSVLLLLFLYVLQGLPLGLAASIPMILAVRYLFYAWD